MSNIDRKIFTIGAIIAGPALLFASQNTDTKNATSPTMNKDAAIVALDIRNCITTVLPRTPDKSNLYCQDLLQIIHTSNLASTNLGCENVTTILDNPPTRTEIETLRDCASAAFIALKP